MMKLFWCPRTRAARAMWMMEELQQPYERVLIDIRDAEAKQDAAFRAASPMGKVPAIQDGEVALAEPAAICLYLADRYPQAGLAPAIDDPRRGRYLYWMTFTPAVIEPAMAEKANGWTPNRVQNGWGDFVTMIDTLRLGLQPGPWLLGETFSAADVMVGSAAYFLQLFGMLPEDTTLRDYVQRCVERPAYQRALAAEPQSSK